MHNDDVGFYTPLLELYDTPLDAPEVLRVKAGEVPVVAGNVHFIGEGLLRKPGVVHGRALIGEGLRVTEVVEVVLWEYAEAHLVKIALVQLLKGLPVYLLGLVGPGIAGGTHGVVGGGIFIGKVVLVHHPQGSVVALCGGGDGEGAGDGPAKGTAHLIGVFPLKAGHEACLIHAFAVIKAVHLYSFVFALKCSCAGVVGEGVALGFSGG